MSRKTLAGEPFVATRIISLGGRCAVAHNLRRFFDFGEAFPFDWWITPFDGLIKFLANPDPDWLYDPAELDLTANKGSVRHSDLGIRLHHEFPRDRVEAQPINPISETRSRCQRPAQPDLSKSSSRSTRNRRAWCCPRESGPSRRKADAGTRHLVQKPHGARWPSRTLQATRACMAGKEIRHYGTKRSPIFRSNSRDATPNAIP